MKLRNKKTGALVEANGVAIYNPPFDLYDKHNKKLISDIQTIPTMYESLSELNEEWEDYAPQEPLIDDVVLRILIHDWAYINKIKKVLYVRHSCSCYLFNEDNRIMIEFVGSIRTLEDGKTYTITELCGEEE